MNIMLARVIAIFVSMLISIAIVATLDYLLQLNDPTLRYVFISMLSSSCAISIYNKLRPTDYSATHSQKTD